MKYWRFIAIGLAFIFLLYYYFAVYRDARQHDLQESNQQQTTQKQWETKIDEQEPILIKVTPTQLGSDQNPWKFEIIFTTHSGDLNQDPTKIVTLVDDKGSIYQPTGWEGPGPGGHHVAGNIVFKPITPLPNWVEVKIKEVGGVPERSFRWNLK